MSQEKILRKPEEFNLKDFKEIDSIPITKKGKWFGLKQKEEKRQPQEEDNKPKEPLLFLIKDNLETQIFEGVPAGLMKFQRSDNKTAQILLTKSKLMSAPWGNEDIRYWTAYENEATAYPTDITHDSAAIYNSIQALMQNRENLEAKKITAWGDLIVKLLLGVVVIVILVFYILPLLGINILGPPTATDVEAGKAAAEALANQTTTGQVIK